MQIITLQAIPNQTFAVTIDQTRYAITLRTIGDETYASITMNGTDLIDGVKCQPNQPIMPYPYLENGGGNFSFYTQNDEYPYYENFGSTHFLLYASAAELAALRG
jgi:hypothetical protein